MNVNCICISISNSIDPFTIPFTPFLSPKRKKTKKNGKLVLNSSNCTIALLFVRWMHPTDNWTITPKEWAFCNSFFVFCFLRFQLCQQICHFFGYSLLEWSRPSDNADSHSNWVWMNLVCSFGWAHSSSVYSSIHWGKVMHMTWVGFINMWRENSLSNYTHKI